MQDEQRHTKNAPKGVVSFKGPTLVRHKDATRFLWGDANPERSQMSSTAETR